MKKFSPLISGILLSLMMTAGAAQAANFVVSPCNIESLTKTLQQKVAEGQSTNLAGKLWWKRCPKDVRKTVWESFLMKPKNDGRAEWQVPTSNPLPVLRTAPDISDTGQWFNGEPLSMSKLRGKVVLVHFWTLGCINCIHTLPNIQGYYEKYQDKGFTVVGVHSPEFAYEKSISNVQEAIRKRGLTYPVVQDNDFSTWNAYGNQYWPAAYLIDRNGNVRFSHFGEGAYKEMDTAIRELLAEQV